MFMLPEVYVINNITFHIHFDRYFREQFILGEIQQVWISTLLIILFIYYFLLPIYGRESIIFRLSFANENFDGFTHFEAC